VSTHAALLNAAHKAAAAADTSSSSSSSRICNGVSKDQGLQQQQQQQQQQCNGVGSSGLKEPAGCDKAGTSSCYGNGTCKAKTAAAAQQQQQQSGCVTRVTSAQLLGALDGNLCRCTGWRPIADCAKVGG
jgi:hypothetical protein